MYKRRNDVHNVRKFGSTLSRSPVDKKKIIKKILVLLVSGGLWMQPSVAECNCLFFTVADPVYPMR